MKKLICCILIFIELFLLTGCKSGDAREVEKSIEGIGTVSVEKEEKIMKKSSMLAAHLNCYPKRTKHRLTILPT